ncbi:diaminopimelate decarboxylase [Flaviflexus huanghaiensis]|uniref:diaminopimelate decarboxylase n=1 Tax=Flaviflexus huanghaiensis TaxID=1111473 RepID=UPI0015FC73AA|nr:diaminopimelate decarboxylase [Flaviflexus huanghaiensis]
MAFAPLAAVPAPEPGFGPWPVNLERVDGELVLAGHKISDLADEGTPLYLVDENDMRDRARAWVHAIGDGDVYYAGKSFLTPGVARWMMSEGLCIDTASEGELRTALAGGVPGERIGLHGNSKSDATLRLALESGVGRIVIDSPGEVDQLAGIAAEMGVVAPCFVRVTTGVHAGGHDFIATAHEDQKFGLSLATGAAQRVVTAISANPHLEFLGLHSHIGSQILDSEGFAAAAAAVMDFAAELIGMGIDVPEVDLGGGYGIQYTGLDPKPAIEIDMIAGIRSAIDAACQRTGIPVPRLSIEPGRSISGPAGMTLYRVGATKDVMTDDGVRRYVSVDGGMSDNIRPALYGADYTALLVRESDADLVPSRVVGMHCESGDIVVRDVALAADVSRGDLLLVAATGAYGRSMASNYNMVRRPGVLAVSEDGTSWLVRPETWDDVLGIFPDC